MRPFNQMSVFMDGVLAGTLARVETESGVFYEFSYDGEFMKKKNAVPMSLTMPFQAEPYRSKILHHPFNGLIPEGWLLDLAIRKLSIGREDRFSLLGELCRDNVGAIEIVPTDCSSPIDLPSLEFDALSDEDAPPSVISPICCGCLTPLPQSGYNRNFHEVCSNVLFGTTTPPLASMPDEWIKDMAERTVRRRMSIAGVQAKFSGRFRSKDRPLFTPGGLFIFKPEPPKIRQFQDLAKFELLCMTLAKRLGIPCADAGLIFTNNHWPVYLTRRFDRTDSMQKIHVEDFSQILGLTLGDDKYSGSAEAVLSAIQSHAGRFAARATEAFVKLTLFNFLVGNSDNHHKNHSLVILPPTDDVPSLRVAFAPAYDLVPTNVFLPDDDAMAISVRGKRTKISKADFRNLFARALMPPNAVDDFIKRFAAEADFLEVALQGLKVEEPKAERFLKIIRQRYEHLMLADSGTLWANNAAKATETKAETLAPEIGSTALLDQLPEPSPFITSNQNDANICQYPGCSLPKGTRRKQYCNEHGQLSDRGQLAKH